MHSNKSGDRKLEKDPTFNTALERKTMRTWASICVAALTTYSLVALGVPAYSAAINLASGADYQWADIEIDFDADEIRDIDLFYGGNDVYTDVFDTGAEFELSETAVFGNASAVTFACDDGEATVDGTTSLLVECDANDGLFSSDYSVSRSFYFWERGSKFRALWTITNNTSTDLSLSAKVSNNFGSDGTNSHYAYGSSSSTSNIPFGDSDDDTAQIVLDEGRWITHYERQDAPMGVTWAGDSVANSGYVVDYDDDDIDLVYVGLKVPANDYLQLAVFYSWPVQTMIDASYTNTATQPLSQANETYLSISSMHSSPTDEMFALVADRSKVVNWASVSESSSSSAQTYQGPVLQSTSELKVYEGDLVTLSGSSLDRVISASVDGVEVPLLSKVENQIQFRIPEVTSGVKDLLMDWSGGTIRHLGAFEVLKPLPDESKTVNAGSFKGYVAVYARGYEGSRLSAKIGSDWVIVDSIVNNQENGSLFRVTDFTGAGVDIAVRIYIDRVLIDTINLTTK